MKPLILVVEDHPKILLNIKVILEFNDYEPIEAENGKEALEILSKLDSPPDVIVSDIMMPEMDGYEFFVKVSENPAWHDIPFIFLSAKSDPDDVRFGKMLGADDYITKPFAEEDLLASIGGKLVRKKHARKIDDKISQVLDSLEIDTKHLIEEEKERIYLFTIFWDEIYGPKVKAHYPEEKKIPFSIQNLGFQLFQTAVSIYGDEKPPEAQGVLLKITHINSYGYIYFDTLEDPEIRGGKKQFMLVSIAPRINYLNSLRIKETFTNIATQIKKGQKWDIKKYWEEITKKLTTPLI